VTLKVGDLSVLRRAAVDEAWTENGCLLHRAYSAPVLIWILYALFYHWYECLMAGFSFALASSMVLVRSP
jgi:hypothetical protein